MDTEINRRTRFPAVMMLMHWLTGILFLAMLVVGFYQATLRMCFDGECFFCELGQLLWGCSKIANSLGNTYIDAKLLDRFNSSLGRLLLA